jgi:RNA polymerase sigma-70 factor, ECF subfamily
LDPATLSSEELVLSCLEAGDERAWAEFVRRFHRLIASVVLRVTRQWGEVSPQVVDDLVQETYLKLCADQCRLLREFKSQHPDAIYGFLKVVAANVVRDHFKAVRSQKRGGVLVTASTDGREITLSEPTESSVAEAMERRLLIQNVDACLQVITTGPTCLRDRRIFWLYYKVGLSAAAIAMLPTISLTTKGVESTLLRLTKQVRKRLAPAKGQGPAHGVPREGIHPAESF